MLLSDDCFSFCKTVSAVEHGDFTGFYQFFEYRRNNSGVYARGVKFGGIVRLFVAKYLQNIIARFVVCIIGRRIPPSMQADLAFAAVAGVLLVEIFEQETTMANIALDIVYHSLYSPAIFLLAQVVNLGPYDHAARLFASLGVNNAGSELVWDIMYNALVGKLFQCFVNIVNAHAGALGKRAFLYIYVIGKYSAVAAQ